MALVHALRPFSARLVRILTLLAAAYLGGQVTVESARSVPLSVALVPLITTTGAIRVSICHFPRQQALASSLSLLTKHVCLSLAGCLAAVLRLQAGRLWGISTRAQIARVSTFISVLSHPVHSSLLILLLPTLVSVVPVFISPQVGAQHVVLTVHLRSGVHHVTASQVTSAQTAQRVLLGTL